MQTQAINLLDKALAGSVAWGVAVFIFGAVLAMTLLSAAALGIVVVTGRRIYLTAQPILVTCES